MEEEKKGNWFPFSDKQEADRASGDFFPSFSGKGFEEVSLVREDIFNDIGRGSHPGQDRLQIREIAQFLHDKFAQAAESGHLPRTYKHYVEEVKKSGALDDKVIRALERHVSEVEKAITAKEQKKTFQEIADYLGKIRMEKR
jgi:hypothetical protein